MADLALPWGGDLQLSTTAGLALADGPALTQQRLIRRLLTNPGDDLWNPGYGAGLGRFVGMPVDVAYLSALIGEQALLEETIASVSSVTVTQNGLGSVSATIVYLDQDGVSQKIAVSR